MSSLRVAGVLFFWFAAVSGAAEPTLTHLFPVAGTQGTTVPVSASGKFDPWPPQVWVDAPGIAFHASKTAGKFDVEIARDAAPGPHLVRFFNDQGASAPRFFIVSTEPELLETEPNDSFQSPQKIEKLPATVSGRLDKPGDVDSFAVTLKKGERLTAGVEAYVLGSTFDGMLRVVDTHGIELAFNHDDGRTLDPLLIWNAPRDGMFIVQLMGFVYPATSGVGLTGGEGCVYRLHLKAEVPAAAPVAAREGDSSGHEPNGAAASDQTPWTIPATIPGCIRKAGDENRIAFTAARLHLYQFNLIAARTGSPLDAWLKIEGKDGKQLTRVDDSGGSRDPQFAWNAPSDGVFTAVIGDLTHRGGANYVYSLAITDAVPAVTATAAVHAISLTAGKTFEVKTTVKRLNRFTAKLQLAAKELPEGVSAPEVEVPDKDGDVTLKIVADAGAPPANRPVQLVLREIESGTEHPVAYFMTVPSDSNSASQGYTELVINSTEQLWLTVIGGAPKPEPPKTEATPD